MAFQITSLTIVYSTVYPGTDQRKHQSSASLAFGRWTVNSPHKGPVTRKICSFEDAIMHSIPNAELCPFSCTCGSISKGLALLGNGLQSNYKWAFTSWCILIAIAFKSTFMRSVQPGPCCKIVQYGNCICGILISMPKEIYSTALPL